MTMIDGVTVLSEEIYRMSPPVIVLAFFFVICALGWVFVIIALYEGFIPDLISGFALTLAMLFATIAFFYLASSPSEQVAYKVVVDDSTSFKEFTARYEIIEQDGEVYTIIDKTENDEE